MDDEITRLRQTFLNEATELIEEMEGHVLALERNPDDLGLLDNLFRCAHSLKGGSGAFGLTAMAHFTHTLEDLFEQLRDGRLSVDRNLLDHLLRSVDALRGMLASAGWETTKDRGGNSPPSAPPPSASPPSASPLDWEIRFEPDPLIFQRGLDPLQVLKEVAHAGGAAEVTADLSGLPPLTEMDPERCYLAWTMRVRDAQRRSLDEAFQFVGDDSVVRIAELPKPGGSSKPRIPSPEITTLRVATEKVERLINLVGEMVITQSIVAQLVMRFTPDRLGLLEATVAQMDRHTRDLQERVMAVRMLPIRTLFNRFPRLVRDLCRAQGKQVRLETSGEDTELDRGVIEQMSDPLTHLVRNAVDHGIEPPALRRQAGKPEVGRLALRAYHQGGNIYIEIADDGGGLDRERILARALEARLVSAEETLSDDRVLALVFHPGFSTAEQVTEVSGRGVGLDVVKRNVETLGGSIAIRSEPGRGTTFRVKLPLTLAILEGQFVRVGKETFVVPLSSIIESVQPSRENLRRVLGEGEAIMIRGEVLPILRLHRRFGVKAALEDPIQGLMVIVEHEDCKVALFVDELLDQQQVVIKSLETNFQKLTGIAGATILGDGRVALILDVPELVLLNRPARTRQELLEPVH